MKKVLIIMNPYAGTMQANRHLVMIIDGFCRAGYAVETATTGEPGDGMRIALERAGSADLVCAIGGDGTFNEVVSGVVDAGLSVPVGYIPAGSTNDFAASLGLSTDIMQAAGDILSGRRKTIDLGSFNGRHFSYVASFGAFTSTSYDVPQSLKNLLGHTAYILGGIKDVFSIKPVRVRFECEEGTYEDDYVFGAVCNSTSMGGILTLDRSLVDMNDGKFEVLLIRNPKNPIELSEILQALLSGELQHCPMIDFFSSGEIRVTAPPTADWTLDGEYQKGTVKILIENVRSAVDIIVPAYRR